LIWAGGDRLAPRPRWQPDGPHHRQTHPLREGPTVAPQPGAPHPLCRRVRPPATRHGRRQRPSRAGRPPRLRPVPGAATSARAAATSEPSKRKPRVMTTGCHSWCCVP